MHVSLFRSRGRSRTLESALRTAQQSTTAMHRFCVVESNMGFLTELGIQDKRKYLFSKGLSVDSLAFARKQLLHTMNKANQRKRECR